MTVDSEIIAQIFAGEGVSLLNWQIASRCTCWKADTKQPQWDHPICGGTGVQYAPAQQIYGLFRTQQRWIDPRMVGELGHGEASLTTPLAAKPGYTDRRVRDRYTVVQATGDSTEGRVFYVAATPVPFLVANQHLAWRVQLTSIRQQDRVVPQP